MVLEPMSGSAVDHLNSAVDHLNSNLCIVEVGNVGMLSPYCHDNGQPAVLQSGRNAVHTLSPVLPTPISINHTSASGCVSGRVP
jgi:hypothetical protein